VAALKKCIRSRQTWGEVIKVAAHGKVYDANYSHDGTYWVVQFDDPDISTFATTLAKAMANAREALAVTLDYDSVEKLEANEVLRDTITFVKSTDADRIAKVRAARKSVETQTRELQRNTEALARDLVHEGMSLRDAATAVGLSHQRVAQLVGSRA
jgi:predicted RNase H-like HicB family nuclease